MQAVIGIWDWDLETNAMTYSERAKAICGFEADTPVTLEMAKAITHPDDLETDLELAKRLMLDERYVREWAHANRAAGHVHYVTMQPESLATKSRITVRYRVHAERARLRAAAPVELKRTGHVLESCQSREQIEVLEHEADRASAKSSSPLLSNARRVVSPEFGWTLVSSPSSWTISSAMTAPRAGGHTPVSL